MKIRIKKKLKLFTSSNEISSLSSATYAVYSLHRQTLIIKPILQLFQLILPQRIQQYSCDITGNRLDYLSVSTAGRWHQIICTARFRNSFISETTNPKTVGCSGMGHYAEIALVAFIVAFLVIISQLTSVAKE